MVSTFPLPKFLLPFEAIVHKKSAQKTLHKNTDKQTHKQTHKLTNKQTYKHKLTNSQTNKQKHKLANSQTLHIGGGIGCTEHNLDPSSVEAWMFVRMNALALRFAAAWRFSGDKCGIPPVRLMLVLTVINCWAVGWRVSWG